MCSRHWRRRTESLSRHRRVTRASTPKSPTLMQDLATRSLRPRNCPAARTHNRNRRRGNEVSLSAFQDQALARENKMPRIPNLPPVKTRLPLAAWAFAGLITLCSIISSLVDGLAPGHGVVNWEQARLQSTASCRRRCSGSRDDSVVSRTEDDKGAGAFRGRTQLDVPIMLTPLTIGSALRAN
jgi:hypothetical protein